MSKSLVYAIICKERKVVYHNQYTIFFICKEDKIFLNASIQISIFVV